MRKFVGIFAVASVFLAAAALDSSAFAGNHNHKFVSHSPCLEKKTHNCGVGHTQPTCKGPHKGPNGVMIQCD